MISCSILITLRYIATYICARCYKFSLLCHSITLNAFNAYYTGSYSQCKRKSIAKLLAKKIVSMYGTHTFTTTALSPIRVSYQDKQWFSGYYTFGDDNPPHDMYLAVRGLNSNATFNY